MDSVKFPNQSRRKFKKIWISKLSVLMERKTFALFFVRVLVCKQHEKSVLRVQNAISEMRSKPIVKCIVAVRPKSSTSAMVAEIDYSEPRPIKKI